MAACDAASMCVKRKPTNWNDMEKRVFQRNAKREPVGRPSIRTSPPLEGSDGAMMVFSQ